MVKNVFFILILFVVLCFTLPIILTNRNKEDTFIEVDKNVIENDGYTYSNYATVALLHKETGEIETLNIDEYLYGVVSAEMPASYEIEALKAQAVVARTYTVYKIAHTGKHSGANVCDDSACCQAWISKEDRFSKWKDEERESNWDKIVQAVNITAGKIITYNGEPINAFFHSNSGGTTETVANVWGGTDYPYLQSVQTSGEDGYSQYQSTVTLSKTEILNKLQERYPNVQINYDEESTIKVVEYTESDRVKTIVFGNISIAGVEARNLLGLKSAKFSVTINDESVTFDVIGYGHGVGMSQTGADAMAKTGSNYEQIVNHYYTNIKIENI